ncbi:MAG: FixH family protein [Pyrinomonadaceae bacterium]|nr:FixH family protein [Sphingobacteriaceae bacterium]
MNWGTKIILAMGLFMGFILILSVKMILSNDDTLIEKDYYEKGLQYDETYNAKQSALTDNVVPIVDLNDYGLTLIFKNPAKCKLNFKRLSNSKMDTIIEQNTDEDFSVYVFENDIEGGPWQLAMEYVINGKTYLLERKIIMP